MKEIVKHINDTNASYRKLGAGDAKNTDLFLDNEHYELFSDAGDAITVRLNKQNLAQAILFIASILPRKYDNSSVHKNVEYSAEFIYEQLAILDGFFTLDGKAVETQTQTWNPRKDVLKKNGEVDNRFYFNGLLSEVVYKNINGIEKTTKFTIRNYLAGGFSDLHIKKLDDGTFEVSISNTLEYYNDHKEDNLEIIAPLSLSEPHQQIYFGAPGTGKSHEIKRAIKKHKAFRITFHPDTDYSSFVGAYKPTSIQVPMLTTLGDKAIPMKDEQGNALTENKIVYTYVKQAFLNAYIEAWKEQENDSPKPVFLVIEEINRGNCAQIFGDIFQLLDRNEANFSDYAVVPDTDLSRHVKADLKHLDIANRDKINAIYEDCENDMVGKVLNGDVLLLPNNLYIWATMNTSDQSLFPIDSAFKRRWDWKYIKIADAHMGWQIKVGSNTYDWWQFVQAINYFVFDATQSEDKNLGYFFAKAKDNAITAETFVSKVIFYLYTDVFKDYGFSGDIFKGLNDEEMTFQSFYNADGSPCNAQIIRFIENVIYSNALPDNLKVDESTDDELSINTSSRFTLNGEELSLKDIANKVVSNYANSHPEENAVTIKTKFIDWCKGIGVAHIVETEEEYNARSHQPSAERSRSAVTIPNGEIIHVSTQWRAKNPEDNFFKFIKICDQQNLGNIIKID